MSGASGRWGQLDHRKSRTKRVRNRLARSLASARLTASHFMNQLLAIGYWLLARLLEPEAV